jgi:hypothetical protein
MWLLFVILKDNDLARIAIPSGEEIADCQEVIPSNIPTLDGVWCMMDGPKIPIHKVGDELTQNTFYNGWLQDHFVGYLFVFIPTRAIVASTVNAP